MGDVEVRAQALRLARHLDALELGRGHEERLGLEPARNPDPGAREQDLPTLGVDDDERETNVPGLVVGSSGDDGDVVPG